MRIGVIGLGNIGGAVAANLVDDGHDVAVHDLRAELADALGGAIRVDGPAEVGEHAEITFLSLPTPDAVDRVATGWAAGAPAGAVAVDLSTNDPARVRALGERLDAGGHHLLDAPLTGGAPGAASRQLVFMVGGADEAVARVRPVLDALGRATFHLGPLGAGSTMKLVNSLVAFCATWSSLEALSVAVKAGIAYPEAVEVVRTAGAGNFWIDRMAETVDRRDRPTQFALDLAAKDAVLLAATAAALDVPTPFGSAIAEVLATAVDEGFGPRDWSSLVEVAEEAAGVELRWGRDR